MGTELLGGHTESVLCLVASNGNQGNNRLLSGGEGGELCLWSLDGESPSKVKVGDGDSDVTSICCSAQRPHEIYAACGEAVHLLDSRQLQHGAVHTFNYNEDEINQIVLNEKESFLAACDDMGNIKVISVHDRRLYKTLRKHTNICSAVTFRPRRQWDLISGGLDSKLLQWDFSKAKNYCDINMEEIGTQDENAQNNYLVNPPFIHSLSMSTDGNFLACGTENALVQIFDSSKRTLEYKKTLRHHTQGVSQVHFLPSFSPEGASVENGDNRKLLLSAGNDGKVVLWDISAPSGETAGGATVNGHGSKQNHQQGEASASAAAVVTNEASANHAQHFKLEINHGEKINWITSCRYQGQLTIAVADNTDKIALYPLPQ